MAKEDGGPAFPLVPLAAANGEIITMGHTGMTLRDYFTGQVLAGFISGSGFYDNPVSYDTKAERAYKMADAMIAERSK